MTEKEAAEKDTGRNQEGKKEENQQSNSWRQTGEELALSGKD